MAHLRMSRLKRNKPEFIRKVGRSSFNGISFDIYINTTGTATLRPCYNDKPLNIKYWITARNLDALERKLDNICGKKCFSIERVTKLIEYFSEVHPGIFEGLS